MYIPPADITREMHKVLARMFSKYRLEEREWDALNAELYELRRIQEQENFINRHR